MSQIKVRIDSQGNATVKAEGFTGDQCLEATKPLEELIGSPDQRERTAESFSVSVDQQVQAQQ